MLEDACVVDRVSAYGIEFGIFKGGCTPIRVVGAFKTDPRVVDEGAHGFFRMRLRPDANDFDARNGPAGVAWVVALAPAEALHLFGAQRSSIFCGAAGQLVERSHRSDLKAGRIRHFDFRSHGVTFQARNEVEVKQDSGPAGAVDPLALDRFPNRCPIPPRGVHRRQAAGVEKRLSALGFEKLETREFPLGFGDAAGMGDGVVLRAA